MSSVEMMNGDGIDRYRRVAFLLWRNEELAGYMMMGDVEVLEFGVVLIRADMGCGRSGQGLICKTWY